MHLVVFVAIFVSLSPYLIWVNGCYWGIETLMLFRIHESDGTEDPTPKCRILFKIFFFFIKVLLSLQPISWTTKTQDLCPRIWLISYSTFNALVFDLQIFDCSETWIPKYRVTCKQVAAGLIVATALQNRKRTPSIAVGGPNGFLWTCFTVMSTIGRFQHADCRSTFTADGLTFVLANGDGRNIL